MSLIPLHLNAAPLGMTVVENILKKWTSSENLLTGSWSAPAAGGTIAADDENTVNVTSTWNLRADFDANTYALTEEFTVSFDAWSTNLSGTTLTLKLLDNFVIPIGTGESITLPAARTRFSVTLIGTGGLSTVKGMEFSQVTPGTGTVHIDRVLVERVTGRDNKNPSTYVPSSVSKQQNSKFHYADATDPGVGYPESCVLIQNPGFCWGENALWVIAGGAFISPGVGQSFHSKQNTTSGRFYDYQITVATQDILSCTVAGNPLGLLNQTTHTGRVVGDTTSSDQLVFGAGGVANGNFTEITVIECDALTNVDGIAFRSSAGDLTVTDKIVM